jgi:hypothetical protein
MNSFKLVTGVILIVALALFSVGLPIVTYLCPMMSSDQPICDMSVPPATGLAVSSQTPDCCAQIIMAERNTTPYVKSDRNPIDFEKILTPVADQVVDYATTIPVASTHSSLFFASEAPSEPLFLLYSSLLL